MLLSTIALLVLFSSIFILFSEELRSSTKRFISNSKVMLLVSLFIASMILLTFEEQIDIFLIKLRVYIYGILYSLGMFPPHLLYFILGKIIILSFVACAMLVIGKCLSRVSVLKKISKNFDTFILIGSVYVWVLFCLVLVVNI